MDALIANDPRNPDLRRELSLSYNRVGEALSRAGRRTEALTVFLQSLRDPPRSLLPPSRTTTSRSGRSR